MRAIVLVLALGCAVLPAQTDTRPLKKRAADLVNAELPAEALKLLVRAREQTPRDPEVHVYAGEAHFQLEEYEKAVAAFREAIAIDSSIAPYLHNLGHALLKLQKTAEARTQFQLIAMPRTPSSKSMPFSRSAFQRR